MTDSEGRERVAGGPIGKLAGKAKAAVGNLTRNDELAREGNLQEAQADAGAEAARHADEAERRQQQADLEARRNAVQTERESLRAEVEAATEAEAAEREPGL